MIVSIHQPEFLPYTGFFSKMLKCDRFILLDNVQAKKNYFENRNKILINGKPNWITVPINQAGRLQCQLKDIIIIQDGGRWRRKIINALTQNYGKHSYAEQIIPKITHIFSLEYTRLSLLNVALISAITETLHYPLSSITTASELGVEGKGTQLLVDIMKHYPGAIYLSGPSGRDYLELDLFEGRKVLYHHHTQLPYTQPGQDKFTPYLSIIDMLCCCGWEKSRELLENGGTFDEC